MAVAAIRKNPSCTTGFLPFKLLNGRERLIPVEISHVEFSTEADYNLAVENHIEQFFETHKSKV